MIHHSSINELFLEKFKMCKTTAEFSALFAEIREDLDFIDNVSAETKAQVYELWSTQFVLEGIRAQNPKEIKLLYDSKKLWPNVSLLGIHHSGPTKQWKEIQSAILLRWDKMVNDHILITKTAEKAYELYTNSPLNQPAKMSAKDLLNELVLDELEKSVDVATLKNMSKWHGLKPSVKTRVKKMILQLQLKSM